jgi:hypothetical protein
MEQYGLQGYPATEGNRLPHHACELDGLQKKKRTRFQQQICPPMVLLEIIKSEGRLWVAADANHLQCNF